VNRRLNPVPAIEVAMVRSRSAKFSYDYPRPALTVDVVLVTRDERPRVLLIRRGKDPFKGRWALPGGFVDENERLIDAAKRELVEETGIELDELEQLYTAGDPGRDPRGWTVSVVFLGRVTDPPAATAADDATEVGWFPLHQPPEMAFDHAAILKRAAVRIADRYA
jgi:8-oxo-dGTP diphosphatase